ncbi:MAG: tetratricopeptide repeat protein [Rhodopirellula sp.]|nr:tetratricopeptide repeat protein [Rhodopirellula sp.]
MPERRLSKQPVVQPGRRLVCLGIVVLVVVVAIWLSGSGGAFALSQTRINLANADVFAAERWLTLAESLGADSAESAFLHARIYRKLGELDEMAASLKLAREAGFSHSKTQLEHLLARAQSGDVSPLESKLSALLVAGDDLPEICEAFVTGCLITYRLDEALLLLEKWLADFPENAQAHFLRGRIYEYRSATEVAESEYRAAIKYSPRHCAARYGLGRLLTDSAPKDAISQFELCADYHINPQPGLVAVSRCQRLLGKLPEARQTIERAIASNSENLELAYRLLGEPTETAASQAPAEYGHVLLAMNDLTGAEKWYRQALEANPNDWRTRFSLATAQRQLGQTDEASTNLKRVEETRKALAACDTAIDSLRVNSEDVEARFLIGKTLLKYVSERQGRIWLESVLRYSPSHEGARELLATPDRSSGPSSN